jgi:hypothetical protein
MSNVGNKVGETYVDLKVRTETVQPALDDAKVKVEQAVDEIENKVVTGNKNIAQSIQGSISKFTAFIGSLTAAVGVATLFFNIGTKIGEALFKIEDVSGRLAKSLSIGFAEPKERVKLLSEEIRTLGDEITALQELPDAIGPQAFQPGIAADSNRQIDQLRKQQEQLIRQRVEAEKQAAREIAEATEAIEEEFAKSSEERQKRRAIDIAEGEEKLALERADALEKVEQMLAAATTERLKAQLKQEIDQINEVFDIRLNRIRQEQAEKDRQRDEQIRKEQQAEDEKERRALESATRQARALERALTSALQSANNQTDALNGRLTVAVEAIESTVRNINANTIRSRN